MICSLIRSASRVALAAFLFLCASVPAPAQQQADPDFDANVATPAFRDKQPRLLFDEAHNNFHTATGRYKPFADLIGNDGYRVTPNKVPFTKEALGACDVLVIANARGAGRPADAAFTDAECDAVRDWVHAGGSLLLITDHAPFGGAAVSLAQRFGVHMSTAFTLDEKNHEKAGGPSWLVFSRENQLLGDHPICRGRGPDEVLRRVTTFTGQSLKGPAGSIAFLKLSDAAVDEDAAAGRKRTSAAGRAQGVALKAGKGRVVVLGEAAVLSAQVVKNPGAKDPGARFGMNFPGSDNRQLALNIMHWLSGLLD